MEVLQVNECDVFLLHYSRKLLCKKSVLPEPLIKIHSFNCLTFEKSTRKPYNDNLGLFRALAPHLYGNDEPEAETPKVAYPQNMEDVDAAKIQSVCKNDFQTVEDLTETNIYLYYIDIVD